MKRNLVLLFLAILLFVWLSLLVDLKNKSIYGNKYIVLNPTMMYWYPKDNSGSVSYYLFERGDYLYCNYTDTNNTFYMCAWKFDTFRDPLFGWIRIKDLEKK